MRNRIIIIMFLLGIGTTSICQNHIYYNIYNNSDSDIVSWIDFDGIYERDSSYLIRNHFHKRIHDFSLTDMFWNIEDYKFDGLTSNLVVLIPAKSQFTYYVNKRCYKKGCFVVTFNRNDVETILGYRFEEKWMNKGNSICILNRNTCYPCDSYKNNKSYFTIVIN